MPGLAGGAGGARGCPLEGMSMGGLRSRRGHGVPSGFRSALLDRTWLGSRAVPPRARPIVLRTSRRVRGAPGSGMRTLRRRRLQSYQTTTRTPPEKGLPLAYIARHDGYAGTFLKVGDPKTRVNLRSKCGLASRISSNRDCRVSRVVAEAVEWDFARALRISTTRSQNSGRLGHQATQDSGRTDLGLIDLRSGSPSA